jgi:glycosyltransferase involved in cell wall biosynthesis
MEELVSVIVPIYKVEKYMHRCVDSIINQTYKKIEIILVDDGSPDSCGKICDEYAEKDNRIKVIHKENGGLSDARNAGIDIAKGNYLTFID